MFRLGKPILLRKLQRKNCNGKICRLELAPGRATIAGFPPCRGRPKRIEYRVMSAE